MTQPHPHRFPGVTFAAIAAELAREAAARARLYPGRVERGLMTAAEATHQRDLVEAWREDLARLERACAPLAGGRPATRVLAPLHHFSWSQRHAALLRELDHRARLYPRWIAEGKLAPADAASRTRCLDALLAIYDDGLDWPTDPAERAALFTQIHARRSGITQQAEMAL